jgi:hypothetical protein
MLMVPRIGTDADTAGSVRIATGHDRKSQVILVDVPKMKVAGVDGDGTRDDRHHDPDCPQEENLKLARRRHVGPGPKCLFVQRLWHKKKIVSSRSFHL